MKNKFTPSSFFYSIPEWSQLSEVLEARSGVSGEWKQFRSVRSKKEASWAIPLLLHWARETNHLGLRYTILKSLATRFTYPWIDELLRWLKSESDLVTQQLINERLIILIDDKSAYQIWLVIQTMPNCDGRAELVKKLYKMGPLRTEIAEWIVNLDRMGELDASMRRVAEEIGVLQKTPKDAWVNVLSSNRPAKTAEVLDKYDSSAENTSLSQMEPTIRIKEVWSGEIGLEDLPKTIEELEEKYNVEVHVGRDLARLLKRRRDVGVLVKVSPRSEGASSNMSLHIALEDVDTATLRLMALE